MDKEKLNSDANDANFHSNNSNASVLRKKLFCE